jgi:hypothetical protein
VFDHACFATRLGGVSGGKETLGCRVSSDTAMAIKSPIFFAAILTTLPESGRLPGNRRR